MATEQRENTGARVTSAHDATRTYICKAPGCTNAARSPVGAYSYCDLHRRSTTTKATRKAGDRVSGLRRLTKTAAHCDKLRAKALELMRKALDAKQAADDADEAYREQLAAALAEREK